VIRKISRKSEQKVVLRPADGASDSAIAKQIRSKTFFVAKGMSFQDLFEFKKMDDYFIDVDDWRNIIVEWLGAEHVTIHTVDGRSLDALWLETAPAEQHAGAVLFHANCAIALDMALWGAWYRQRGISALMVTMGGYAGSEGETTELSSYFDADASINFLLKKNISKEKIVAHGLSIGGALASAAAVMHPGISCTVDQTFVTAKEVASTTAKLISKRVPDFLVDKVVNTCFPKGKTDPRISLATDAYDNVAKARRIRGMYFVMWGEDDAMMPPAFAEELFEAHYAGAIEEAKAGATSLAIDRVKELLFKLGAEWANVNSETVKGQRSMLLELVHNVSIEQLAAKKTCRIAHGEHGCFFGDDPISTRVYETYLRGLGLVRELHFAPDEEIQW